VGVVRDSHHESIQEDPYPFVYMPYRQRQSLGSLTFYLRTATDPASLSNSVRSTIVQLDPNLPIYDVRSFAEQIDQQLSSSRLLAVLALAFGLLAALLAAMGVYALLAYTVSQRTREIGVRMAVGAKREDIARMVLVQTARYAFAGIAAGIALSLAAAQLINGLFFKTSSADPASVGISIGVLMLIAALAAAIPARRAATIEPTEALRAE
jgi:ABC-type antimicrobial peptide transport system permease subunit